MNVRWQHAVLALILAIFTWQLVTGRERVETWMPLSVEMANVPQGLIVHDGLVSKVEVRLRGPRGLVRSLNEKKLVYPLDAGKLKVGENVVEFSVDKIPLSRAYEVVEIKPSRIILTTDRIIFKTVPVQVSWEDQGDLDRNFRLLELSSEPDHVELKGPESVLRRIEAADARLYAVFEGEPPRSHSEQVPIVPPAEVEANPSVVKVEMRLGPVTQRVPVRIHSFEMEPPEGYLVQVKTNSVLLQVEGPRLLFRNDEYRKEMAVVLRFDDEIAPGVHKLQYAVKLPLDCQLVSKEPETVTVVLEKQE